MFVGAAETGAEDKAVRIPVRVIARSGVDGRLTASLI